MKDLRLEFYKARRKNLWVIMIVMTLLEVFWVYASLADASIDTSQGFASLFYRLPMINAIILPILIAILVSRMCDMEHVGSMLKELFTMQKASSLFNAKFVCIAIVVLVAMALQALSILFISSIQGYTDTPTIFELIMFSLSQYVVCVFIVLLVQIVSLKFKNQFVPLATGLLLSLLGLFAMFFPPAVMRFVPSSYFALLSTTEMGWDPVSRIITFLQHEFSLIDFVILITAGIVLYLISHRMFIKKEV